MAEVFGLAGPLIKLALGRGKAAKAEYALSPLDDVVRGLQALPKDLSLKYQNQALNKASKPGIQALRAQVARIGQVTGNLLASVSSTKRKYTNNKRQIPVGVVVIGFRRPTNAQSQQGAESAFGGTVKRGPNRAYHSHIVEYGSSGRRTPGKTRRINRRRAVVGGRIRTVFDTVQDKPSSDRAIMSSFKTRGFTRRANYPIDFIATGSVAPMPALHPLKKAFQQSEPQMRSLIDIEMRKALSNAIRAYQRRMGDL